MEFYKGKGVIRDVLLRQRMFALHPRDEFWSSFFKSLRVWAEPIKNSVFFLIAFSFALTVSKEKAVYKLDFIKI